MHTLKLASTVCLLISLACNTFTAERPFKLMVGDNAPDLKIERWIKGDPVDFFEHEHIYVIEFWASWCGPCVKGMPHLTKLQEDYADEVTIIGVNIWDRDHAVDAFMSEEHPAMARTGHDLMGYTVAVEEKIDAKTGFMATYWMEAAGKSGIPTAFIVDGDSKIAWIGHPARIDEPLQAIVEGTWNADAEGDRSAKAANSKAQMGKFKKLMKSKSYDEAYELAAELVSGSLAEDAMALNDIAWAIVDPDNPPGHVDLNLALTAANKANKLTEYKNPHILDTVAQVYFERGELDKAVAVQKLAVSKAKGKPQLKKELTKRLRKFKKALERSQD